MPRRRPSPTACRSLLSTIEPLLSLIATWIRLDSPAALPSSALRSPTIASWSRRIRGSNLASTGSTSIKGKTSETLKPRPLRGSNSSSSTNTVVHPLPPRTRANVDFASSSRKSIRTFVSTPASIRAGQPTEVLPRRPALCPNQLSSGQSLPEIDGAFAPLHQPRFHPPRERGICAPSWTVRPR